MAESLAGPGATYRYRLKNRNPLGHILLASESRTGACHAFNFDRMVVDEALQLFAVIDSERDDGTAGDIVVTGLRRSRSELLKAQRRGVIEVEKAMRGIIHDANTEIHKSWAEGGTRSAGGASITALMVAGESMVVAHVGECRLYVYDEVAGRWRRVTNDHTLLEEQERGLAAVPLPAIEPTLAACILTRSVGPSPSVDIDTTVLPLCRPETTAMLCSSGAWRPVDPTARAGFLKSVPQAELAASAILHAHAEDGARDNATVVVIRVLPDGDITTA